MMARSGSPNAIGLGRDFVYNSSMKSTLQNIFERMAQELESLENRWVVLIIAVIMMLGFRAIGLAGLADLLGMIYIMYFVTFWRRRD